MGVGGDDSQSNTGRKGRCESARPGSVMKGKAVAERGVSTRGDDGDVGQVRASSLGVIGEENIA